MYNKIDDLKDKFGLYVAIIIVAIVLSFILYLLPITGVGNKEVIKIYYADNISEAHRKIMDEFNRVNKGKIEVVAVDLPFTKFNTNERKEILARALRSKSSVIDVFAVDHIWVARFSRWAEPLDSYFSKDELDKVIPEALKTCYYEGVLYGMPIYFDIGLLYYRKDLVKKFENLLSFDEDRNPIVTWDDIFEIKEKYFRDRPVYVFHGNDYEGLVCNLVEIYGGLGYSTEKLDKFNFRDSDIVNTFHFIKELLDSRVSPRKVVEFDEIESWQYALTNDIPFFRGWPSFQVMTEIPGVDQSKIDNLGRTYVVFKKGAKPSPVIGGWNLMVSRYSPNKAAAVKFVKFVQQETSQWILRKEGEFLPVLKALYYKKEYTDLDPDLRFFGKYFKYGVQRPVHIEYTKISDIIASNLNLMLKNKISVDESILKIDEQLKKIIRKDKEVLK